MRNRVGVEAVLDSSELFTKFCSQKPELPELIKSIGDEFAVKVSMEKDIVEGFIADSSNLPGEAAVGYSLACNASGLRRGNVALCAIG